MSSVSRHIVALTCPNGHEHDFKREEICNGKRHVFRGPDCEESWKDKLVVHCPTCKVAFEACVDCRGV